jgi:hypothetical protein
MRVEQEEAHRVELNRSNFSCIKKRRKLKKLPEFFLNRKKTERITLFPKKAPP